MSDAVQHPRSRGVIALDPATCTSCMICARECPDWCITITAHHETVAAADVGAGARGAGSRRQRTYAVLDSFTIDYSQCLYCGICVEACPVDALAWAPEHDYPAASRDGLVHNVDELSQWRERLVAQPQLEVGASEPQGRRRGRV